MTCNSCRDGDHVHHNQWAPCDCVGECEQRDTIPELVVFESDPPDQSVRTLFPVAERIR